MMGVYGYHPFCVGGFFDPFDVGCCGAGLFNEACGLQAAHHFAVR